MQNGFAQTRHKISVGSFTLSSLQAILHIAPGVIRDPFCPLTEPYIHLSQELPNTVQPSIFQKDAAPLEHPVFSPVLFAAASTVLSTGAR